MSAKESVAIFGTTMTEKSIEEEIIGLVDRLAISPVQQSNFGWNAKTVMPMSLFLLKDKYTDGKFVKLKARLVAEGHRRGHDSYPNARHTSPTVII